LDQQRIATLFVPKSSDLKPGNMPLGRKDSETSVYIVDFGIARRYRNPQNGAHMPFLDGKLVVGTIHYVSLNTHLGIGTSFTFAKYSKLSEFIIFQSTDAVR